MLLHNLLSVNLSKQIIAFLITYSMISFNKDDEKNDS